MGFLAIIKTSQIHSKQTKTPLNLYNLNNSFPFLDNTVLSIQFYPAVGFVTRISHAKLPCKGENQKLFHD